MSNRTKNLVKTSRIHAASSHESASPAAGSTPVGLKGEGASRRLVRKPENVHDGNAPEKAHSAHHRISPKSAREPFCHVYNLASLTVSFSHGRLCASPVLGHRQNVQSGVLPRFFNSGVCLKITNNNMEETNSARGTNNKRKKGRNTETNTYMDG